MACMRNTIGAHGFTALELLVTLATTAVLVAVAVPSLDAMIKRSRLTAAHNEFIAAIYQLRSEAAKRNRVVKMCRSIDLGTPSCDTSESGGWHTGWVIWVDSDNSNEIDGDEYPISVHGPFADGVHLVGNTNVAQRVAFRSTGATYGAGNGTFTVCVEGGTSKREIVLSRPGRLRTRDLASDGNC
jgi:type IV fimbrial biogenesis protein FimT